MGVVIPQTVPASEDRASGAQVIDGSLKFVKSQATRLDFTNIGINTTFTASLWVKRHSLTPETFQHFFFTSATANGNAGCGIGFDGNDKITVYNGGHNLTDRVFRDCSSWYHFALKVTSGTADLYVNNELAKSGVTGFQLSSSARIGDYSYGSYPADISISQVYLIDGQALDPSYFGFTDPLTNTWRPKKYVRTSTITGDTGSAVGFGTNGFYLPFDTDGVEIGTDRSGKENHWTINNFVTTAAGIQTNPNIMPDSPSGISFSTAPTSGIGTTTGMTKPSNYTTLNPLTGAITLTNGNLDGNSTGGAWRGATGTIGVSSGKWYWESTIQNTDSGNYYGEFGFIKTTDITGAITNPSAKNGIIYYARNGRKISGGTSVVTSSSGATTGDVVQVAVDLDAGKIWFGVNNTWIDSGNPASGTNAAYTGLSGTYLPTIGVYDSGKCSTNFGQKPFKYAPPAGFLPLCTANLPRPTIVRPDQFVGIVTYQGTGASLTTSFGFTPDLIWTKNRSAAHQHRWFDSVRGNNMTLSSDTTGVEQSISSSLSIVTNGFTVGTSTVANTSGNGYVAWGWKAGGQIGVGRSFMINDVGYATTTAAGLTAGGIVPSGASVNTKAGFSIVKYTYSGSGSLLVPHGLGTTPKVVLLKSTDSTLNWYWYTTQIDGSYDYLILNGLDGKTDSGGAAPTSTVFTTLATAATYTAYLWAEIPGFSKFGSYTGNSSTDGPMIITGFRPAFIIIKITSTSSHWVMFDSKRSGYNAETNALAPSSPEYEDYYVLTPSLDLLSNGFKLRSSSGYINSSGHSYIYAAYAEAPAQNLFGGQSNAR